MAAPFDVDAMPVPVLDWCRVILAVAEKTGWVKSVNGEINIFDGYWFMELVQRYIGFRTKKMA